MIIIIMGSLSAATPSVFDVGVLNYYKIQSLADTDFASYTPGLRLEAHIVPWFGLGLDALIETPFVDNGSFDILATTDITFRAPIGFFEPYIALGPAYRIAITSGAVALTKDVAYSARAGFDFNITSIFTIGAEAKLVVDDLPGIIAGTAGTIDWLDSTLVGLTLKAKF